MTRTFKIAAAIVTCCVMSACTTFYEKPGASQQQFNVENSICETQAAGMYPPDFQQVQILAGHYTPMLTTCNAYGCTTTGGDWIPPVNMLVDQNIGARRGAAESCLLAKGWRKDHETFLGMTVRSY